MRQTTAPPLSLIGEEIAGAWNEVALSDIAAAFGGRYIAYCRDAEPSGTDPVLADGPPSALDGFDYLIAAENTPRSECAYMFRPPRGGSSALIVGNEAKGLRRSSLKRADHVVSIPIPSLNINCLNVAAAAAVLLYYLSMDQPLPHKSRSMSAVTAHRPGVLIVGGSDHMELGSALRSVCALGWERVLLDDRADAWYECSRLIKSEGRGAARRGRNPIRISPYRDECLHAYRKAVVFTNKEAGKASHALPLAGADTLLVLADESDCSYPWAPPPDWPGEVRYAALPEVSRDRYHFRQTSAIGLAEAARQLGHPQSDGIYLRARQDRYRREISPGETEAPLDIDDLAIF